LTFRCSPDADNVQIHTLFPCRRERFQALIRFSAYGGARLWRAFWLRHPAWAAWSPVFVPAPFRCPARPSGWWRALCPLSALGLALLTGACGMSTKFGLPAAGGKADTSAKADSGDLISALSTGAFSDDDLIVASTSAAALLARGKGGPWENRQTGARGTITPIAAVYRDNGVECRDFLVSYVHDKAEAWMQGEACRTSAGPWEVRSLKPWRR
jgi:surface antigen